MVEKVILPRVTCWGSWLSLAVSLPSQPNHTPPSSSSAASTPTASPPAAGRLGFGIATRLETVIRRPLPLMYCSLDCLGPALAEAHGPVDDTGHAVGLREVAPQRIVPRVYVLGEHAQRIPAAQHVLVEFPSLFLPADGRERVDVPEGADVERVFRLAEVVGGGVTERVMPAAELLLDGVHGADEARVVGLQETEVVHHQQARVHLRAPEALGEGLLPVVPGLLADDLVDVARLTAPVGRAVGEAEARGDARQPVAGGPAHERGEGVHPLPAPVLPEAGVGLVVQPHRDGAELLEQLEFGHAAGMREALVEEHLGGGEHHRAIDVVLVLLVGLIAEAHRSHTPITGQGLDHALGEIGAAADGVDGLQLLQSGLGVDVDDVAQILLHGLRGAEAVQHVHHEVAVAQPAVAVIPVAPAARGLRDGGGHRRDHRARVLESAELQRDGRTYHGFLPLERDGETSRPAPPEAFRSLEVVVVGVRYGLRDGLVRPEDQMHRPVEHEAGLVQHPGDRYVRRKPQPHAGAQIADVVAAAAGLAGLAPVIPRRVQSDADARAPAQGLDRAYQHHGPEHATHVGITRSEVRDGNGAAVAIVQGGAQYRRVRHVLLLGALEVLQFDLEVAGPLAVFLAAQQAAEDGIAVELGHAAPDHHPPAVDERGDLAIADDSEIQIRHARPLYVVVSGGSGNRDNDGSPDAVKSPPARRATRRPPRCPAATSAPACRSAAHFRAREWNAHPVRSPPRSRLRP